MSSFFNLGSGLAILIPVITVVSFIVCCVALSCLCCRKRPRQRQNVTTIVYTPPPLNQPPVSGYHPSYPAYQPVPLHAHGGPPSAAAPPPSYLEATNPALSPYNPGPSMYLQPAQPSGCPDVHAQLPYNPAFCPDTASHSQSLPFNKC